MRFRCSTSQHHNLVNSVSHHDKVTLICYRACPSIIFDIIYLQHQQCRLYGVNIACRRERACLREDNAMLMDKLGQLWEIQKQQQQHHLVVNSEQAPHEQVSAGNVYGSMWLCASVSNTA